MYSVNDREKVLVLKSMGKSTLSIARTLEVSERTVRNIISGKWRPQINKQQTHQELLPQNQAKYLPTPEQIRIATEEIRAGWSEEERINRRVINNGGVKILTTSINKRKVKVG